MAPKISGKQRAVRIPLDYYKHRDPLTRWKLALAVLAPALALGWWFGGDAWSRGQTALRASHGPVAAVHATWEQQCEACHVPFRPIGPETWPKEYLQRVGLAFDRSDAKCRACHQGPAHHQNQVDAEVPACASCHRDHRGRDASLVRSPDRDCTTCHAGLTRHIRPGAPAAGYADAIHAFDEDHPEFAILRAAPPSPGSKPRDPSDLLFNHAVHLTPGLKQGYTLEKIADQQARDRYRQQTKDGTRQADNDEVRLDCASCHVLDPGDLGAGTVPTPALSGRGGPGATMVPIVYENQCRACHPLDISRPGAGRRMVAAADAGAGQGAGNGKPLPPLTVPHGLQTDAVHEFLTHGVAAAVLRADPELATRPRRPGPVDAAVRTVREEIEAQVLRAERTLYQGNQTCSECHAYDPLVPGEEAQVRPGQAPNFRVRGPNVPDVWFRHAVFDHAAHRAVDCRQCHAGAYATDADGSPRPGASTTSDDVLLPGIDTCRQCHAPARQVASTPRGGARFDCVECHRYHHGDRPEQGVGALAQGALQRVGLENFLQPTGHRSRSPTGAIPARTSKAPPGSP